MIFFESFSALGYSGWNLAVAFFFLGGFGAALTKLNRRPLWLRIAYPTAVLALFIVTVIWMAPLLDAVARANADWEKRRDADPRVEMQRQQR